VEPIAAPPANPAPDSHPPDRRESEFVALYERHYPSVLAYARRRADESVARDVAAETFLVAWRRLDEALERGLPWLYRTAALQLRNTQRAQRRQERTAGRLAGLAAAPPQADPAAELAERQSLAEALARLPEGERELLRLVVWEQLDLRTAAAVAGCSPGAAAVRLHRARRRLRPHLSAPTPFENPEVTP
jgi:RNA polymerase sigma factor (sigma-70 family)